MNNITPIAYENNAKKHSPEQLYKIALSIRDFGWRQSIVVDRDHVIVVGHGRWLAYERYKNEMEMAEPIIDVAEDLTAEQTQAYRLADNLLSSTEYDAEKILEETEQVALPFKEMLDFNIGAEGKKEDTQEEDFINDEGYLEYLNMSIRQVVLHYKQNEFTELVKKCEALNSKFKFDTNSDLFKKLVEQEYEKISN